MKFGQYELLELIAVGGMAEVFKGRVVGAEGFEKFVAIKRILPDLAEDERFVKMLLTEARIHSALSHRNIVQIHDLGISEDGQYFIVLEFVEGYDLRVISDQLAAAGEIIPEVLSLHIASEVAQGLHFAHELRSEDGQPLGLIHRDVTPSNVLISFAGEVKLSDFGLAKRRHDRSVVGSLKGNMSYMSPEQANQAPLDRRTDVFSLGVVLWEMLTGRRLREITDEVAGWSHVASGIVPSVRSLRPDLPPNIGRLLDRALAADSEQRFTDAGAFGAAIREVLGEMNIPVGASDLAALLGLVSPPRQPRNLMMERSRVIRLGPEARALREVIAAPATPAPIPVARPRERERTTPKVESPGMTPSPPRLAPPIRQSAAAVARAPVADPAATPPPETPLPPVRPRQRTPLAAAPPSGPPPLTARQSGHYPVAASQSRPAGPGSGRIAPPSAAAMPGYGAPSVAAASRGTPAFGVSRPAPQNFRGTPAFGVQRPPGNDFRASPAFGVQRPAPNDFRGAPGGRQTGPAFGVRSAGFPSFGDLGRPQRETARVQSLRSRGRWGRRFFFLLVVLGGGAAAVHHWLVPLDVVLVWRNPATAWIATDPDGASVKVDGVALTGVSPTTVTVHRDLLDHVIEAAHPGFLPAHKTVRFDKSVGLAFVLTLEKDPTYVAPAPVAEPTGPPGAFPVRPAAP